MRTPESQRLFNSYRSIRQHCYNPNNAQYQRTQAAGLNIKCFWNSFRQFETYVDERLGPCPGPGYRIARIDMTRDYAPGNIAWSTTREQMDRQRLSHKIEYRGETHCITEWSRILGISVWTLWKRYERGAKTAERLFRSVQ